MSARDNSVTVPPAFNETPGALGLTMCPAFVTELAPPLRYTPCVIRPLDRLVTEEPPANMLTLNCDCDEIRPAFTSDRATVPLPLTGLNADMMVPVAWLVTEPPAVIRTPALPWLELPAGIRPALIPVPGAPAFLIPTN